MSKLPKFRPQKLGAQCDLCPRKGQVPVPPEGPKGARWCWLGQDPGAVEVEQGRPFVGPTGKRLTRVWDNACAELEHPVPREEVWITNAALCAPKTPGVKEARDAVLCCRPRLMRELAQLSPHAGILVMGKNAALALFGTDKNVGAYHGFHVRLRQPEGATAPADLRIRTRRE